MTDEAREAIVEAVRYPVAVLGCSEAGYCRPDAERCLCKRITVAAIAAHEKALSAAGLGIRPREPSEAMLNAARDWSLKKYGLGIGNDAAIGCWQAMDAAAERERQP